MTKAKLNDTVTINYIGRLDDGTLFETTYGKEPCTFTIGEKNVIAAIDEAVIDMEVGENRFITATPDKAYGPYDEMLVSTLPRSELPPKIKPVVDMVLRGPTGPEDDSPNLTVRITEVTDDTVTFDGNHILAGKDLTFEIELLDISIKNEK